jgi:hypothetical protein
MKNTPDVTGGKPIGVLLQSIPSVSAINPLVAFYDIHGRKREVYEMYMRVCDANISFYSIFYIKVTRRLVTNCKSFGVISTIIIRPPANEFRKKIKIDFRNINNKGHIRSCRLRPSSRSSLRGRLTITHY